MDQWTGRDAILYPSKTVGPDDKLYVTDFLYGKFMCGKFLVIQYIIFVLTQALCHKFVMGMESFL